jgi:hypothetical protein
MIQVIGNFALFPEQRPAALVVSHERSGTHFLMNALAACYGYVSTPWVDFDRPAFNINFFNSSEIREILLAVASRPIANVVKSHHPAEFFDDGLKHITERYVVFVMCRNPVAVMLSFWRYLHQWPWFEGPKAADPLELARAEPFGRMMGHQLRQHRNLMQRWAAHVDGWLDVAAVLPNVVIVRYEDLDACYEETMRRFAPYLGRDPLAIARPARDFNVIPGGPPDPTGRGVAPDIETLQKLCQESVGNTMARLGYLERGVMSAANRKPCPPSFSNDSTGNAPPLVTGLGVVGEPTRPT